MSAASSGPPRASDELLRRSRARSGLLGELIQVEALFANPQIEIEQDDGDGRDRRDQRTQQRRADLDERGLEVASAEEGREQAEENEERVRNDGLQDRDDHQDSKRAPPLPLDEVPAASQAADRTNVLGHHRRYRKRPAHQKVDGGAKHGQPGKD